MERNELARLVEQQRAQLEQLAYQKHVIETQLRQLQGNIDATYGSVQMLEHLLGMDSEEVPSIQGMPEPEEEVE